MQDLPPIRLERRDHDRFHQVVFPAMACDCEVLIETGDADLAGIIGRAVAAEAIRIERKYSRYRDDNIVHAINHAAGERIEVDPETAGLLDYAEACFGLSDGRFDITSGVLREVWRFDGSDRIPEPDAVAAVMARVGWRKLRWQRPWLELKPGMELDFGGIGKEYAVDRCVDRISGEDWPACLVNFGGDLRISRPRLDGQPWRIGVDTPSAPGTPSRIVELRHGALATSGDANRFLLRDGIRYGHLLDPRNGWPVREAPRSVTVAARLCVEAGMLSSLALLQGRGAESFLARQGCRYWCDRTKPED